MRWCWSARTTCAAAGSARPTTAMRWRSPSPSRSRRSTTAKSAFWPRPSSVGSARSCEGRNEWRRPGPQRPASPSLRACCASKRRDCDLRNIDMIWAAQGKGHAWTAPRRQPYLAAMARSGRPPLEGIRVVDFSRVIAGPMCTQILSDMGAEVLKIENPDGGDDTRKGAGPRAAGESHFYMTFNRGKKSVALDFTKPDGQAVVHKLIASADVLVQNFRPGVPKKYGFDYASLHKK